jgi:ectoine hydroxylase-related dioxygenase (phytanoyl-CoA dioxygenase family)
MELARGRANFHHSMMMHGSHLNTTDKVRRAMDVNAILTAPCIFH